jgi:hypothetical protein
MKNLLNILGIILIIILSSCSAIVGIFKAGMGFGIFLSVAVVAVIILILIKAGGKK